MPIAQVNGRRVAYEDTGGGGPAVIFSHGLLMDREMFAPQLEALRGEFRCIAWDARGHGDSDEATEPFTYWDSAEDMFALAAHLGVERAFLVGMSQGGFLSLRAALRRPDFLLGLGLIDTQAGVEDPEMADNDRAMGHVWKEHGLNDDLAEIIAAMIMSPGYPGNADWIAKWKRRPTEHIDMPLTPLLNREDLHDRLGEIAAPAIVVHGEVDAAISVELAQRLVDGLPNCERLVLVPGAGHASNLSHPEPVNAALGDFLRRHSGVAAQ
ncbi:MAG TPA: alpha/beta hydrolase [Candidatus Dormibacteraeota bacterium]|jgi:pimeloyl-ACP methyl ester carboxylesterase|nr:alpha/beta hydrolase [Candidatus Dormibacteraeota bacterium]